MKLLQYKISYYIYEELKRQSYEHVFRHCSSIPVLPARCMKNLGHHQIYCTKAEKLFMASINQPQNVYGALAFFLLCKPSLEA